MAAQLPGRTDNEIKNYWNTRIKRRQRAGLPLYPPEIQRRVAIMNQRQGSLMLIENQNRPKNFLTGVPPPATLFSNAAGGNYSMGNFDLSYPPPPPPPLQSSNYFMKMELPSAQFFVDAVGDEKLLPSPALRNAHFNASFQGCQGIYHENFASGGFSAIAEQPLSSKCPEMDAFCKSGSPDFSNGTQLKKQAAELQPPLGAANQDLSGLLDMVPANMATPTTQIISDWCNSGPSSTVTEDDLRLQMQKLASTLSTAHEWGFGSCSWDNMPGIH